MTKDTETSAGTQGIKMYDAFRKNGEPTYYDESHTPWQADILECGFIFAGCILALAFFSILPGINGKSKFFTFIWIVISVSVGTTIIVTNYSYAWEVSEISTPTKYKSGTGEEIHAHVGLHIGLRGINITLKGEPVHQLNETINYNEHFGWTWRQGRNFFGPFASNFNQEYRAAQFRGLPLPILWVAEYFTLDGEGIRWGRFYREAGLYAHTCLWIAFACWILANILIFVLIRYGAYLIIFTGLCMGATNAIKHFLRSDLDLVIPFTAEHILIVHYGPAFWLCLVTGGLCFVCGWLMLIIDLRAPNATATFFGMDILQDENHIQIEPASKANSNLTEIVEVGSNGEVVKRIDVRPAGALQNGSKITQSEAVRRARNLDNVLGDLNIDSCDDTTDSDSCLSATDDEYDDDESPHQDTRSKGLIQRLQVKRRVPSAKPSPYRKSELKQRAVNLYNKKRSTVHPNGQQQRK